MIGRVAGGAALARAAPMVVALGMMAALVMGPTGMHPADVVAAADGSRAVRLALWGLWLAATAPAMLAALTCRELVYLRALPVARWVWWAVAAAVALAVAAPWAGLFWAGGGAARGCAAGLGAAGLAMAVPVALGLLGRGRLREGAAAILPAAAVATLVLWRGGGAGGAGGGAAAGAGAAWAAILAATGAVALAAAIPLGWRRAPELVRPRQARRLVGGPAPVALALALAAALWRRERAALVRGGAIAGLAGAVAGLAGLGLYGAAAVAMVAVGCAAFALSAPLARADRGLRWLCDAAGAAKPLRGSASGLVAAAWGAVAGGLFAASAAWAGAGAGASAQAGAGAGVGVGAGAVAMAAPVSGLGLALGPALGAALGLAAAGGARLADRESGVDGVRAVLVGAIVIGGGLAVVAALAASAGGG